MANEQFFKSSFVFLIIIFLLAKACWYGLIYDGAFTWHLCKVIREKRARAYIREFLRQKALWTSGSIFMQCAAKETKNDIDWRCCILVKFRGMFKEIISANKNLTII